MADAYTQVSSLDSVQAAYDRLAYFALRPEMYFDMMADIKPTKQSMPGSSVKFTTYVEMAEATTALSETVDVDAVALDDGQTTVTLVEQGNAVLTTAKLRGTSFNNVDADAANLIGYNAGISLDTLARTPLVAGTNVLYGGSASSRVTVAAASVITASNVRKAYARLVGANVQGWDGYFKAVIHPDVSYDLKSETGAASWNEPHAYAMPGNIWNGQVGSFSGFDFMESPRAKIFVDAGVGGTVDVYASLFMGKQCLAKAFSSAVSAEQPQTVRGAVVDKLARFQPIGWYWLGGYARFREASIQRYETSSSIGTN